MPIALNNYQHISFDLDGTLYHTLPDYRHTLVKEAVARLGGTVSDEEAIDRFWFHPNREDTIRACFNVAPEIFWDFFHLLDTPERRAPYSHIYDDVGRTLTRIKNAGKRISIITGAPQWIAEMALGKLAMTVHDHLHSITSNGFEPKPHPGSFHCVLEKLNAEPHHTLYIGNSTEDALFAHNAGVDFVYINRGENKFDQEVSHVGIIQTLDELEI